MLVDALRGAAPGAITIYDFGAVLTSRHAARVETHSLALQESILMARLARDRPHDVRLIGPANALDLLLSGRKIDAAEALRLGLVQRVLPRGEVLAAAQAYATQLATECSSYSLWVIRRPVWAALDSSLEAAAKEAVTLRGESFEGADFREAVIAAAEGRRAVFR